MGNIPSLVSSLSPRARPFHLQGKRFTLRMQNTLIWTTATPLVTFRARGPALAPDWTSLLSPSSHFLCLALPPSLPSFFLNLTVPTSERVHPRERRKIVKINELLFSLAVRPTDRATAGAAAAVPSPALFLASCGTVDSKRRKDGKSRGEEWREGETVVVLPFLPLLHALDNPSGGSNSLFEGQFHCCRHRLCRIGDGNTSWTSLSLPLSSPPLPFFPSHCELEPGARNGLAKFQIYANAASGRCCGGEREADRRESGVD